MPRTNKNDEDKDKNRKPTTTRKTSRTSKRKPKVEATKKEEPASAPKQQQPTANKKTTSRRSTSRRTPAKRKPPVKAKAREIRLKMKEEEKSPVAKKRVIRRKTEDKKDKTVQRTSGRTTSRDSSESTTNRTTSSRSNSSNSTNSRNKATQSDSQSNKDTNTTKSSSSSKTTSTPVVVTQTPKVEPPAIISVRVHQTVAVLIDGNNIEMSIHSMMHNKSAMLDFDKVIPKILEDRGLNRLIYFREGLNISEKLAERLHKHYHGSVVPCHKSADIPLTITATQIAEKVDTIIIMSGDSDYVELVRHLKSRGVRVEIASVKATTAQILIDEADYSYEINKEDCFVFK